jgi:hypothetical protein
MKITELSLAELDREAVGIRKTLERVPEGNNDWKPHEKSMPLGYLATIVATIPPGGPKFKPQEWKRGRDLPAWLDMVVNMDELDIWKACRNPPRTCPGCGVSSRGRGVPSTSAGFWFWSTGTSDVCWLGWNEFGRFQL